MLSSEQLRHFADTQSRQDIARLTRELAQLRATNDANFAAAAQTLAENARLKANLDDAGAFAGEMADQNIELRRDMATIISRSITDCGKHMGQWRYRFRGPMRGYMYREHAHETWEEAVAEFRKVWVETEGGGE